MNATVRVALDAMGGDNAPGETVLGAAQIVPWAHKATFATSSLPVGSTRVTATYYGNSNVAKSSASIVQVVQ